MPDLGSSNGQGGGKTGARYRSDIDGLRALAVASVVLYHAGWRMIPGGFVGVDIFFVISGYLIASILVAELRSNSFSILNFYERRIRRIFPALFCVLAVSTVCALWLLAPRDLAAYSRSLVWATLFTSNIFFWAESGYFESDAELMPNLHTWSLAVEEQFYIFFPILLWLAWRVRREKVLIWAAVILSLALSIYGVRSHLVATFYLLPTRAWELLLGSVLALGAMPRINRRAIQEVVALVGLGLILAGLLLIRRTTLFPGEMALLPCGGAALVIYAGIDGNKTLVARLLSFRPLAFLGLISYSLYLWHWPVLVFARYANLDPLSPGQVASAMLLALALAILSWRFVERPFRSRHRGVAASAGYVDLPLSNRRVVGTGLATIAVFVAIGFAIDRTANDEGLVRRFYGDDVADVDRAARHFDSPRRCRGSASAALRRDCIVGDPDKPTRIALWGDSFADAFVPGVGDIDPDSSVYRFVFHSCPSILGAARVDDRPGWAAFGRNCRDFNEHVIEALGKMPEVRTVVLINNYSWYLNTRDNDSGLVLHPDGFDGDDEPTRRELTVDRIIATASRLSAMGKHVVILGAFYARTQFGAISTLRSLMRDVTARAKSRVSVAEFDNRTRLLNDPLRQLRDPNIVFVDPRDIFCPDAAATQLCSYDQGMPLLVDEGHFTGPGAHRVAVAIRQALGVMASRETIVATPSRN